MTLVVFRSKYEKDNEVRYMAVTQFEATDARRCIPCWDEPALKAVFEVTLIVPENRDAISNMNVVEKKDHPDKKNMKIVRFAPTVVMSTYLLAFVVGEVEYVESIAENGIPIRVYTQHGKSEQGTFGLEVALKVLPWLEKFYNLRYPLPKLDLIAIPDFSAGAMENFGLVTYRETALLVDPKNSSASAKQWVALVVSHEIAHMWFGNTVTMAWWESLWLNEGFATAVEYLCVDHIFPEWNILEQFVHDDYGRAQSLDALASSHPVEVEIKAAAEVDEVFDAISYSKGCALIYMLINFLGAETFNKGVRNYLEKFKFSNAVTEDLWNALAEASGKDIASMMNTWTKQTGYPVLDIKSDDNKTFTITQNRYLDLGVQYEDPSQWIIPFGYITSKNPTSPVYSLLTEKTSTITIDEDDIEWIKFNPSQTAFCRVSYPIASYKKFVPAIRNKSLGAIDRLGIQEDTCSLARAGAISSSAALEILSAYSEEDNYTVWTGIATNLDHFWNILKNEDESIVSAFKEFARNLFKKQSERLGWTPKANESHLDTMLRELVISSLTKYEDPETLKIGKEKFAEFVKNTSAVVPDLRTSVLKIVLHDGDEEVFNQVLDLYRKEKLQEEQVRCLKALGATRDTNLIKKTLQFALSEDVRSQDTFFVVGGLLDNPVATDLLWDWFTENIETLKKRYDGGFLYGRFIKYAVMSFTKEEQLKLVKDFFTNESNRTVGSLRSIDQAIETVQLNVDWLKRAKSEVQQFFQ
jgi:puromycin-sensitive aminopeptidase